MSGAEWKAFYSDKKYWPDGAWHEWELVTINGVEQDDGADLGQVEDDAIVLAEGGTVYLSEDAEDGPTMDAHAKRWRKEHSEVMLIVSAPKDKAKQVKAAIKAAGGRVLR